MPSRPDMILPRLRRVIFKAVGDGRPYPDHGYTTPRQWSKVAPRQVRLDELVTTKRTLDLAQLLSEDSTFYGDLFAHVVQWRDTMYLEDGLHRAVRAALAQRPVLHARVLVLAGAGGMNNHGGPRAEPEDEPEAEAADVARATPPGE